MRLAPLRASWIALLAAPLLVPSAALAVNYVEVVLFRVDIPDKPAGTYDLEVSIVIPDVAGVLDVALIAGQTGLDVEEDPDNDDGEWSAEKDFPSLAAAAAALQGTWTITITADQSSVSTFSFNSNQLTEGDFYPLPTLVAPVQDASDVSLDTLFEWLDPTGAETPYVVILSAGPQSGEEFEEVSVPFGSLAIDATSFNFPLLHAPGESEWGISYVRGDASFIPGAIATGDPIVWGNSPFAPDALPFGPWPASTPLLAMISVAEVEYTTLPLISDFENDPIQNDSTGPEFVVTTTGDPMDPVLFSASDSLIASTGIADVGGSNAWTFDSLSGSTGTVDGTDGHLLSGAIPGEGAVQGGQFAEFFSAPRNLWQQSIRASVRQSGGGDGLQSSVASAQQSAPVVTTQFRFAATDESDNQAATELFPLTENFAEHSAASFDFSDFSSNEGQTDFGNIVGLGIEFFTDPAVPGMPPPFGFEVDEFEILPEPNAAGLIAAALATLGWIGTARRRSAQPRDERTARP